MKPDHRVAGTDLPWLVPLGVAVLLGTWFTNEHRFSQGETVAAGGCAALAVAGLLVALRLPRTGTVVTSTAVAAFALLDVEDGPIYLTLAAAAFLVAARVDLRRSIPPVAAGAALVWAALLFSDAGEHGNLIQLLAVGGVMTAGGAIGTLVRNRRLEAHERARAAATAEQLRMARELHDGVGHGLAVIAMQAGVGIHVIEKDPAAARAALEAIRDSARESLDALRAELSQLTGEAASRPTRGLADLAALVDRVRATGLRVTLTGAPGPVPERVDATAYAVVQEALTNVLKHAGATSTSVGLTRDAHRLAVAITDNGNGGSVRDMGMGLQGMRQRVEALGGSFTAGPRAAGGFEVRAELPV